MGQKVHPYGFRLGIIRKSRSNWFAEGTRYRDQLQADLKIRRFLMHHLQNAGISEILIERTADNVSVTLRTARPGIVIGRGGRDVDVLRQRMEKMMGGRVRLNVEETPEPDLNAQLIAENIAAQIHRRISHRRAMQQAVERAVRMGALGVKACVSGRLSGAEIARTEKVGPIGRVPLHTLRADVDYGAALAQTAYGPIGIKVWVYHGEILPPRKGQPRTDEAGGATAEDWERVAEAARRLSATEAAPAAAALAVVVEEVAAVVEETATAKTLAEPVAEAPVEPVAEAPAEVEPEAPAEPVAEAPAEVEPEAPAEPVAEAPAEPVAEAPAEVEPEAPAETHEPEATAEPGEEPPAAVE